MSKLLSWLYIVRKTFFTRSKQIHYSQFGEDVVLRDWFYRQTAGIFIDVGSYHPSKHSNTYWLYQHGWRGVNIDVDDIKIRAFAMARPNDININIGVSDHEDTLTLYRFNKYGLGTTLDPDVARATKIPLLETKQVKVKTLELILSDTPYKDSVIDVMNIDAEGHDLHVLKGFDFDKHKPKLIMIELHTDDISEVLASDLHGYLLEKNYIMCNWVGLTLFYRRADVHLKELPR